jgi:hypothetical protein
MDLFRGARDRRRPTPDDDPTEVLRFWREQQQQERLADTREFPRFADGSPEPEVAGSGREVRPHRRKTSLLLAAGVGGLAVVAGVALASAADRPSQGGAPDSAVTTAPSGAGRPSADPTSPTTTPTDTGGPGTDDQPGGGTGDDGGATSPPDEGPGDSGVGIGPGDQASPPTGPGAGPGAGGPGAGGPGAGGPGAGGPGAGGPGADGPGADGGPAGPA